MNLFFSLAALSLLSHIETRAGFTSLESMTDRIWKWMKNWEMRSSALTKGNLRKVLVQLLLSFPSLPSDYMFVTPVEVDAEGRYLTHDVTRKDHHHHHRSRRSLPESLHYRFSAFGRDVHLDLHPSSVVGPGFTVQTLNSGGISTLLDDVAFHHCLYQGFIRNLSASSAAISTCAGLVSVSSYSCWFF